MVNYVYKYCVKMLDGEIIRDLTTEEAEDLIHNHNGILVSTTRTRVPEKENVVKNITPNLTTKDDDNVSYLLEVDGLSDDCTNGNQSDYILIAGQGHEYKDDVRQLDTFNR